MTTLIIDGAALFARAFFVDMEDPVFSVKRSARTVLHRVAPDLLLWAWDGETRKSDKAHKPKPPQYAIAMAEARKMLEDTYGGVTCVATAGEADDVIASAVVQELRHRNAVVIATSDGDMDYLCVDGVRIYSLVDKTYKDKTTILKKWGVAKLAHIPLVKALVGDTGDGIAGVPGIGKVKALKLYASAVTPDMKFDPARKAITAALLPGQRADYATAIEAVMLYTHLPVPLAESCVRVCDG
jgi:DNA polymerase-1